MSKFSTAHIFLDANTALHFKRADHIDWCALSGEKKVLLVGAPVLMRELENQKVHNPSRKLRERADTYIKWLVLFVRNSSKEVRPGVRWHFIPHEPQIDFIKNHLSTTIADDHLIASILTYQAEPPGPIYLATADLGLEVKLRARQIGLLSIPKSEKLPSEPDPQEKELRDLRLETARYKSRLPQLALKFKDGEDRLEVLIKPPLSVKSLPNIRSHYLPAPIPPEDTSAPKTKHGIFLLSNSITRDELIKYNEDLEAFFNSHKKYQSELSAWKEKCALLVKVELTFSNEGTAPASDIDVVLDFSDDLELFGKKLNGFPKIPDEPEPPRKPGSLDLNKTLGNWGSTGLNIFNHSIPTLEFDGCPCVENEKSQVTFSLNNLKHNFDEELEEFYFCFPSRDDVRSFNFTYHLSAAELPKQIRGELHVVVASI